MRLTTAQVGPLTASDDDGVSLSQTCPSASALVIDGAFASDYSVNRIATAQAVAGAGDLTLNTAATNLGGRSVVIASAGNDTGITFTVKGVGTDGVSYASETVTGSNTSRVATRTLFMKVTAISASGAAAGNVSAGVNGILATLDTARRVLLTSSGNDSAKTFTVYGTDWNGTPISEVVTGANATTTFSTLDFATITAVWPSASTAGTIKVGTNGVASSRPIFLDRYALAPTSLQVDVSGTANYTVQQTLDDANSVGYVNVNWVNHPDSGVVAVAATAQANYAYIPTATRVTLNSQTNPGFVVFTVLQASGTPV